MCGLRKDVGVQVCPKAAVLRMQLFLRWLASGSGVVWQGWKKWAVVPNRKQLGSLGLNPDLLAVSHICLLVCEAESSSS
jgi:hypothetical protein